MNNSPFSSLLNHFCLLRVSSSQNWRLKVVHRIWNVKTKNCVLIQCLRKIISFAKNCVYAFKIIYYFVSHIVFNSYTNSWIKYCWHTFNYIKMFSYNLECLKEKMKDIRPFQLHSIAVDRESKISHWTWEYLIVISKLSNEELKELFFYSSCFVELACDSNSELNSIKIYDVNSALRDNWKFYKLKNPLAIWNF